MIGVIFFVFIMIAIAVALLRIGGIILTILGVFAIFYGALGIAGILAHVADEKTYMNDKEEKLK